MKVIEWNINHRYGHSKKEMPKWIKDVIEEEEATIIVLTETSFMSIAICLIVMIIMSFVVIIQLSEITKLLLQ